VSAEGHVAAGQNTEALRAEIVRIQAEQVRLQTALETERSALEAERSRGLLRKLFGLRPRTVEDPERTREKMRGRLAIALVLTLIVVMGLTFWYLLTLSRNFGELTTDDLIALIPMVGTVLLTPLVGLIGAVMGFYYGGQTAVQAASQTADATKAAAETTQRTAAAAVAQAQDGTSGRTQNGPS
jgi:hypothetical protein